MDADVARQLGEGSRNWYSRLDLVVGDLPQRRPTTTAIRLKVRRMDSQPCDLLTDRLVVATLGDQPECLEDAMHVLAYGDGAFKLLVRVPASTLHSTTVRDGCASY